MLILEDIKMQKESNGVSYGTYLSGFQIDFERNPEKEKDYGKNALLIIKNLIYILFINFN